jgi:hypothetical protein
MPALPSIVPAGSLGFDAAPFCQTAIPTYSPYEFRLALACRRQDRPAMNEAELLARITVNPKIFGGKPIIRGQRLAVEHVLGMLI